MRKSGEKFQVRAKKTLFQIGALLTIVIVWAGAASRVPSYLIPGPMVVARRLLIIAGTTDFWHEISVSLYRLIVGFTAAGTFGIVVGLIASVKRGFRLYVRSLISILQSVPPIAWVPMLIILLGFGDKPIFVVISISAFFPVAIGVINGSEEVEQSQVQLARVMGANNIQLLYKVYAPALLPSILTGLQVSFGNAWRSLIAAEMVGGVNTGIGWSITYAGEVADMSGVLLGIVVIGTIATILERVVLGITYKKLIPWRSET